MTLFAYDWVASLAARLELDRGRPSPRRGAVRRRGRRSPSPSPRSIRASAAQPPRASARDYGDFGNLLLTVAMFWAYIAYTQYFIVWSEDLPHGSAWYWPRVSTSWRWLALVVLVLDFALPFARDAVPRHQAQPRLAAASSA